MAQIIDTADRQIILGYIKFLQDSDLYDNPENQVEYCKKVGMHPKLLRSSPYFSMVQDLFEDKSNIERLLDLKLKDYLKYQYYYLHQGYRYGLPDLQQKWLGHDLIKTPWDCWIYQEIIYETKPDVILELGIMFGGATHFYASMLDLVGHGEVIGVDVDISKVKSIDNERISLVEGSSVSQETVEKLRPKLEGKNVLVIADSDHEKNHVLQEIRCYAPFVQVGGYFIVEDSLNDVMDYHPVPNEGPQAAAKAFLEENDDFAVDMRMGEKYIMSLNPYGYLKRVK